MALPEKNYYCLQELKDRWGITCLDIRYYAEHGLLEVQAWLPELVVRLYRNKRTEDGEIAPVPIGVSSYKGYAAVEPDELRKIFRNSPRTVEKFKNPSNNDLIKILDTNTRFMIAIEDLVICKSERDRFEKTYSLDSPSLQPITSRKSMPSFSGRPSVMHRINTEFEHRCTQGEVKDSLRQEAISLAAWAQINIDDMQTPTAKTIMNALRSQYQKRVRENVPQSEQIAVARN